MNSGTFVVFVDANSGLIAVDIFVLKIANFLADWQQIAIDNTRYTVVLIFLTALVSGLMVALRYRYRISALQLQLEDTLSAGKQADLDFAKLDRTTEQETKQSEIINRQLTESEQNRLSIEAELREKERLLADKQEALENLQVILDDKTERIDQLQNELAEQKSVQSLTLDPSRDESDNKTGQQKPDQDRMAEMARESAQLATDLNVVKQQLLQLEAELVSKNDQIRQLANNRPPSDPSDIERVNELENQLAQLKAEGEQAISRDQYQRLEQEKQTAESKIQHLNELEHYFQQHNEQLIKLNRQLTSALPENPGFTPNTGEIDSAQTRKEISVSIWQQHRDLIERLLQQAAKRRSDSEQIVELAALQENINAQQNHIDRLQYDLEIKKALIKNQNTPLQAIPAAIIERQQADLAKIEALQKKLADRKNRFSVDLNEPLEEVSETIGLLQDKVKGFYRKWIT